MATASRTRSVNATGSATVQRKTAETLTVTPSAVSTSCAGTRSRRSRRSTTWSSERRRTTCRPGPSTAVGSPSRRTRRASHGWTVREGRNRNFSRDMVGPPSRSAVGGWVVKDGGVVVEPGWWPATTATRGDRSRRADRIRLRARRCALVAGHHLWRSESRTHRSEQLRCHSPCRAMWRGTTRGTGPGTPAPPLISPRTSVGGAPARTHLVFRSLSAPSGTMTG